MSEFFIGVTAVSLLVLLVSLVARHRERVREWYEMRYEADKLRKID